MCLSITLIFLINVVVSIQRPRPITHYDPYFTPRYVRPSFVDLSKLTKETDTTTPADKDAGRAGPFRNRHLNAPFLRAEIGLDKQVTGYVPGLCPVTDVEGDASLVKDLVAKALYYTNGKDEKQTLGLYIGDTQLDADQSLDAQNVPKGAELLLKPVVPVVVEPEAASSLTQLPGAICDPSLVDPTTCAKDKPTETMMYRVLWRSALVMALFMSLLLLLAATLQGTFRLIVRRLLRFEDKYMTELIESAFRQVSVIALALALLHVIESFNIIAASLDMLLFKDLYVAIQGDDSATSTGGNVTQTYLIFNAARSFVENFTLVYATFVCLFALLAFRTFHYLKHAELLTVEQILVERAHKTYLAYLVARFEYLDWFKTRGIVELDPPHLWFMEYHRACLISVCIELIRLPVSALLFLQCLIWFVLPLSQVFGIKSVLVSLSLQGLCLLGLIIVKLKVFMIRRNLLPPDPLKYVHVRHQMKTALAQPGNLSTDTTVAEALRTNLPRYQMNPTTTPLKTYGWLQRLLYGVQSPSNHEALFWFWRRGPGLLIRVVEGCLLGTMVLSAFVGREASSKPELWWDRYLSWPVLCYVSLIACAAALMPGLISQLTYISSTHMLIKEQIWHDVVVTSRAGFVKQLAFLIDALKSSSYITSLQDSRSAATLWEGLRRNCESLPLDIQDQREGMWRRLQHKGPISAQSLSRFFADKGFNLADEAVADKWLRTFSGRGNDPTGKAPSPQPPTLDKTDFFMMMTVVDEVLTEHLNEGDLSSLLNLWDIDEREPVTVESLRRLAVETGLRWDDIALLHFITFARKDLNARTMTQKQLVTALIDIDQGTLGTLNTAVNRLQRSISAPHFLAEEPELM